jgi:hypothetical protein
MALIDLWKSSQEQLRQKHVQQIIAFAGDGKLLDGREASKEFRSFLDQVPSSLLTRYADECLSDSFAGSGYALQDIVNQVGRRLGFTVTDGRYRGSPARIGFDGLWHFPNDHAVVIEVKTTDAYRIKLNTVIGYHRALIKNETVSEDGSSVLIVVGRQDTGDLEAQIRGSRHAWDVRLISVNGLLRLMALKEAVEDPEIDGSIALICAVSKEHGSGGQASYWFAFHPHQKDFLESAEKAYVAFGCGSRDHVLLIPFAAFEPWLEGMNVTQSDERFYWHISIFQENGTFVLHRKRGHTRIDLTSYFLLDD